MWSVTRENFEKTRKVNVNFTIDKHLYEQFKRVAQKDMRKYIYWCDPGTPINRGKLGSSQPWRYKKEKGFYD